jgi:CheY-like chemotaxis protein
LLEKKDLLGADPIATQISGRQRQDWREQADLPVNDPQVKKSVRLLAEKIASAISRASATVRDDPIEENRRSIELRNTADLVAREQAPKDKSSRRLILWVDDRPDNNIMERNAFSAYNIDFVLALSTKEAMNKLSELHFDAMISDMGRPPDPQAGYTLLHKVRSSGNAIPFFIYAGSRAPQHREEARRRGAQGTTNMPAELIQMVLEGIALRDGEANDDRPR